jgi:CDP-diglyceride synthetase
MGSTLALFAFCILCAILYFLPAIIASRREHRNRNAILMLDLLAGWTFVGWVVAMVWACTDNVESRIGGFPGPQ